MVDRSISNSEPKKISARRLLSVILILGLFFVGLLIGIPLLIARDMQHRPDSWTKVHVGDSYADVKAKLPNLDTSMHDIKGLDQLSEPTLTGYWITLYTFDQDTRLEWKTSYYLVWNQDSPHMQFLSETMHK